MYKVMRFLSILEDNRPKDILLILRRFWGDFLISTLSSKILLYHFRKSHKRSYFTGKDPWRMNGFYKSLPRVFFTARWSFERWLRGKRVLTIGSGCVHMINTRAILQTLFGTVDRIRSRDCLARSCLWGNPTPTTIKSKSKGPIGDHYLEKEWGGTTCSSFFSPITSNIFFQIVTCRPHNIPNHSSFF
ncbi:unnamed protein product [Arabidopsis thaliana]|uniref:Uncharacterized protein n=1 Tax=Arabidopsis thaliana TaxID=3702 RepID=Q9FKA1_ARATH|nr:unnamed protein product [Arabidopsis thaliana]